MEFQALSSQKMYILIVDSRNRIIGPQTPLSDFNFGLSPKTTARITLSHKAFLFIILVLAFWLISYI